MKETYLLQQSGTETTHPTTTAPTGLWERLTNRMRGWFEVPLGYQDENGFHYGPEPRPTTMTGSGTPESREVFTDRASQAIQYAATVAPRPEAAPAGERRAAASDRFGSGRDGAAPAARSKSP